MSERKLPSELTVNDLKEGDRAMLDREFRNRSKVTIVRFTPKRLWATVRANDGTEWETMSYRLSPLLIEEQTIEERVLKNDIREEEKEEVAETLLLIEQNKGCAGKIVRTKNGKIGITKNSDVPVNGKILVYATVGKMLCDPKNLETIGFHD